LKTLIFGIKEEIMFLDGLIVEIIKTIIWPKLVAENKNMGQLPQLMYNLKRVCRTWQIWVEEKQEWGGGRKFGTYQYEDFAKDGYNCNFDGLPYDMYPNGYWDDY
jgi:hypothetical protein